MTRIERVKQFLLERFNIVAACFIAVLFLAGVDRMSSADLEVGALLVALALFLLVSTLYIIPEKDCWVIELLGQYYDTKNAGFHFLIPGLMKIRKKWYLGDQLLSLIMDDKPDERDGKTRGKVETTDDSVGVLAGLTIQVTDPYKATYAIDDLKPAILDAVEDTTRSELGRLSTDNVIKSTDALAKKIKKRHEDQIKEWGVEFKKYFLKDLNLSPETTESRRERIKAESARQKTVKLAEGEKEANVLRGEGEGERIERAMKATGLTAEQILGGNLTIEQAAALAKATVILSGGSPGPINIPAATAEVQKVLDALRRSKEEEKK